MDTNLSVKSRELLAELIKNENLDISAGSILKSQLEKFSTSNDMLLYLQFLQSKIENNDVVSMIDTNYNDFLYKNGSAGILFKNLTAEEIEGLQDEIKEKEFKLPLLKNRINEIYKLIQKEITTLSKSNSLNIEAKDLDEKNEKIYGFKLLDEENNIDKIIGLATILKNDGFFDSDVRHFQTLLTGKKIKSPTINWMGRGAFSEICYLYYELNRRNIIDKKINSPYQTILKAFTINGHPIVNTVKTTSSLVSAFGKGKDLPKRHLKIKKILDDQGF